MLEAREVVGDRTETRDRELWLDPLGHGLHVLPGLNPVQGGRHPVGGSKPVLPGVFGARRLLHAEVELVTHVTSDGGRTGDLSVCRLARAGINVNGEDADGRRRCVRHVTNELRDWLVGGTARTSLVVGVGTCLSVSLLGVRVSSEYTNDSVLYSDVGWDSRRSNLNVGCDDSIANHFASDLDARELNKVTNDEGRHDLGVWCLPVWGLATAVGRVEASQVE